MVEEGLWKCDGRCRSTAKGLPMILPNYPSDNLRLPPFHSERKIFCGGPIGSFQKTINVIVIWRDCRQRRLRRGRIIRRQRIFLTKCLHYRQYAAPRRSSLLYFLFIQDRSQTNGRGENEKFSFRF